MRGWALSWEAYSQAAVQAARQVFEQALAKDPKWTDAKNGVAAVLVASIANGWSGSVQQDQARAEQLLLEVFERDPNNSLAHTSIGILYRIQNRLAESRIELEKAIALDRNNTFTLRNLGSTLVQMGEPETAIPFIEKAIRLSPHDPFIGSSYQWLGRCHLLLGHVDQAVDLLKKARAANPRLWFIHLWLAGALGLKGELDDAKAALAEAIKLKPDLNSMAAWRATTPGLTNASYWALAEQTVNVGLRRAGFPEQ